MNSSEQLPGSNDGADTNTKVEALVAVVCGQWLAVELRYIETVIKLGLVSPLPLLPSYMPGAMAHGQEPLVLIDPARFLELKDCVRAAEVQQRRVVVVESKELRAGLVIDGAAEIGVLSIRQGDMTDLRGSDAVSQYLLGECVQADRVIAVLDLPRLLEGARV